MAVKIYDLPVDRDWNALTMFSVLMELKLATNSWQETFVGTPARVHGSGREGELVSLESGVGVD